MKKNYSSATRNILFVLLILFSYKELRAQFIDYFNEDVIIFDPTAENGWTFYTGDGNATISLSTTDQGYAEINVDATNDTRNIWWAIIRRCVSENMQVDLLDKEGFEVRVETRIRVSDAPKRVNLSINTESTTDFHSNLMEFDIPDTIDWHTISFTTDGFRLNEGDNIYAQLALMDWGLNKYRVDIDYYKADIVRVDTLSSDLGNVVPYHPMVESPEMFEYHLPVKESAVISKPYPDKNFYHLSELNGTDAERIISLNNSQIIIMKWDLGEVSNDECVNSGILELTTNYLERDTEYKKDFGMIRVSEIIDRDNCWDEKNVTYNSFLAGKTLDDVVNSQMVIDVEVTPGKGRKTYLIISQPVLKRMADGTTTGLAIRPLGLIHVSFYAKGENPNYCPKLHLIKRMDNK